MRVLSKGLFHVRVNFVGGGGYLYFGKLTFYYFSKFVPFKVAI